MNKIYIFSIATVVNVMLLCHGWALELSGTIYDINGMPNANQTLLLTRHETVEEMSQSLDPKGSYPTDVNVEIAGKGWSCKSDELGHYIFTNLQSGIYDIIVLGGEYPFSQQQEDVDYDYGGRHIELFSESVTGLALTPVPIEYFTIHGELRYIEDDAPVQAEVGISPIPSAAGPNMSRPEIILKLMKSANSDENGMFIKHNAQVGNYMIDVSIKDQTSISTRLVANFDICPDGDIVISNTELQRVAECGVKLTLWTMKQTSIQ